MGEVLSCLIFIEYKTIYDIGDFYGGLLGMNHVVFLLFGFGTLVTGLFVSIKLVIVGSVLTGVVIALAVCSQFLVNAEQRRQQQEARRIHWTIEPPQEQQRQQTEETQPQQRAEETQPRQGAVERHEEEQRRIRDLQRRINQAMVRMNNVSAENTVR